MKALAQNTYGSSEVLQFRDVPTPSLGDKDVLVRVAAAGLDRGAWHLMTGQPYLMRVLGFGFRAPKRVVPGTNFAGTVEQVGRLVDGFSPGDEVYGTASGAFAEQVVAPADKLAPKPSLLTFEQAAVLPYAAFVALQALRDHGKVQPGQRVLVVGASGAVGTIAVQLAVGLGAIVTGVCSAQHEELVRSLGASDVIDYTTQDIADRPGQFDLVIDIGGRTSIRRLRRALTRTGTLVIIGGEGDRFTGGLQRQLWASLLTAFVPQKLRSFVVKERAADLADVNALVASGKVTPLLERSYALADGAHAVEEFESGRVHGRIALVP
jgi:NADPH:quinone reductase-like Zn-dependent oxidoreductase